MNDVSELEFAGASAEKGWGMFVDLRSGDSLLRFSVSGETLGALQPSAKHFPEIFEARLPLILKAARMLATTRRLSAIPDIGGTEITLAHLQEAERA